jgi:transposase
MPEQFVSRNAAAAFDYDSTLVAALELSGRSWELGAVVPGLTRRARRRLEARDLAGLQEALRRWASGRMLERVVLTYEAGRDGFWLARALEARGIEVHVMHPASIPVPRRGRRAKTDRIDLDMLLRTFLAWLRGEPRVCTMAPIPSESEEDLRRPSRERERLVSERVQLENRIESLLCLHGIAGFKPRLKKAEERLEALRGIDGRELPRHGMAELRRLMERHRLACDQIKAIEAERDQVLSVARPSREERMIQLLARFAGLGAETARQLVHEVLCRRFRDRRALASYVGLTGTPFNSGGATREQGIDRHGNARARRILIQLAWRWLRFQPDSGLSRWFFERTAGAKGRIRKVMIVALARKLLVALWRYVQTGEVPDGARIVAR